MPGDVSFENILGVLDIAYDITEHVSDGRTEQRQNDNHNDSH
jgi:hypothetical protein